MRRLLLASSSPYRQELLSRLRLPFESCARTSMKQVYPEKAPSNS